MRVDDARYAKVCQNVIGVPFEIGCDDLTEANKIADGGTGVRSGGCVESESEPPCEDQTNYPTSDGSAS